MLGIPSANLHSPVARPPLRTSHRQAINISRAALWASVGFDLSSRLQDIEDLARQQPLGRSLIHAAKQLFSAVSGLTTKLIDVLIIVNLASAVGTATIETGVGAVAGYGVAAYYAWQAYDLDNEIPTFYGNAEATFRGIAGSIAMIEAGSWLARLPELKPYQHPGQG